MNGEFVSLLQRLPCQYLCLLGKNRQRQSYYPPGMRGRLALAGPSRPPEGAAGTGRAALPSSGKAPRGVPAAICTGLLLSQNCHPWLVWREKRKEWIQISVGTDLRILQHMLATMSQDSWALLPSLTGVCRLLLDKFPHLAVSHLQITD